MTATYIFDLETQEEASGIMFAAAYNGYAATLREAEFGSGFAYELSVQLADDGLDPHRALRIIVGDTKLPVFGPFGDADDDDRINSYRIVGNRVRWFYGDDDKLEGEVL